MPCTAFSNSTLRMEMTEMKVEVVNVTGVKLLGLEPRPRYPGFSHQELHSLPSKRESIKEGFLLSNCPDIIG